MSEYVRDLRAKIGTTVLEIPTVAVLTFDQSDRVLLVRHVEGNDWTTPGGMIEPYELPSNAAVREMWEETGLHVSADTHCRCIWRDTLLRHLFQRRQGGMGIDRIWGGAHSRHAEARWRRDTRGSIFLAGGDTHPSLQAACPAVSRSGTRRPAESALPAGHVAAAGCVTLIVAALRDHGSRRNSSRK